MVINQMINTAFAVSRNGMPEQSKPQLLVVPIGIITTEIGEL